MAEYVDELRLGIQVEDNNSGEKVKSLASAISSLNTAISKVDTAKLAETFKTLKTEIGGFADELKSAEKSLTAMAEIIKKTGTIAKAKEQVKTVDIGGEGKEVAPLEAYQKAIERINEQIKASELGSDKQIKLIKQRNRYEKEYGELLKKNAEIPQNETSKIQPGTNIAEQSNLAESQVNLVMQENQKILSEQLTLRDLNINRLERLTTKLEEENLTEEETRKILIEIERLRKQINKDQKSALSQDFWRVNKYRIIREIIKQLAEGIRDIAKQAAEISPQMNKSLSQVVSSVDILKASIGTVAISLLPMIAPTLQFIAQIIGTIANIISKTIATLSRQSSYLKVNTDYWKDYNEQVKEAQGNLLAFDTFTTLSMQNQSNLPDILSKENTLLGDLGLESEKELADEILGTLEEIVLVVGALFAFGAWGKLLSFLKKIKTTISDMSTSSVMLISLTAAFVSILDFIDTIMHWDETPLVSKIASITAALLGVAAVIFSILAATGVGNVKVMKAIAVGLSAAALISVGVSTAFKGKKSSANTTAFADGGMFEGAGTMYAIAGESGAEVVAQGSAGTGVLNVSQFKQAMVEALYEYGAARGQLDGISVNMDGNSVGRAVAASGGFKNEAIRRGNSWR